MDNTNNQQQNQGFQFRKIGTYLLIGLSFLNPIKLIQKGTLFFKKKPDQQNKQQGQQNDDINQNEGTINMGGYKEDNSLEGAFDHYCGEAKKLKKLSNEQQLKLYSFYKQSTEGDNNREPPSMIDFVSQAKHRAWSELKGMSKEEAMQNYIALVEIFQGKQTNKKSTINELGESEDEEDDEEQENVIFNKKFQTFSKPPQQEEDQEILSPIFQATKDQDINKLSEIIQSCTKEELIQTNESGITIFHYAIDQDLQKSFEFLKQIIQKNNLVNLQDSQGMTPLHYAVLVDNKEYVSQLLDLGADFNIQDEDGETPYSSADMDMKQFIKDQKYNQMD